MNMARFRHPLKLAQVEREKLEMLLSINPQWKVAEILGVSQMTVSRMANHLEIIGQGQTIANRLKGPAHSKLMKGKYLNGELIAYWKGKKFPKEVVAARSTKMKGRPAWNSGTKLEKISTQEDKSWKLPQ